MAYYAPSSEPPPDRIGRLRYLIKALYSRADAEPGHCEYGGQNGECHGKCPLRPLFGRDPALLAESAGSVRDEDFGILTGWSG